MRNKLLISSLIIVILTWVKSTPIYSQSNSSAISPITHKADSLYRVGEIEASSSFAEVALFMHKNNHDTTSLSYANTLRVVGNSQYRLSNFEEAANYLKESIRVFETFLAGECFYYPMAMISLAACIAETNEFEKSIPLGEKAIEYIRSHIGKKSSLYAKALSEHGYNLMYEGDFINSKIICNDAVNIYKEIADTNSLEYANALAYYAETLSYLGDYETSLKINQSAIEVMNRNGYQNHPDNAFILNNQGYFYSLYGDFISAAPYIEEATNLRKSTLGISHSEHIHSVANLAVIYQCTGDYDNALECALKALYLGDLTEGKNNRTYASALQTIAGIYNDMGEHENALKSSSQSLNIIKSIYGTRHYAYVDALLDLSECYSYANEYDKAINYSEEALEIISTEYDLNSDEAAYCYELLCDQYRATGNYDKALKYIEKSILIRLQLFGKTNKKYLNSLLSLITTKDNMKICDPKSVSEYNSIQSEILRKAFANLTSHRRSLMWDEYKDWFIDYLPTYVNKYRNDSLNCVLYDAALLSKGILLSTEQELSAIVSRHGNSELNKLYEEYRQTNALLNTLQNSPLDEHFLDTDSLSNRIEILEKTLMSKSKDFGDFTRSFNVRWQDIKDKLDPNSIAIEFIEYANDKRERVYCVLTLKSSYDYPHLTQICSLNDIERLSPELYYSSPELSNLIFAKLEEELKGVKTVYFAPAGVFYSIAIESLPYKSASHRFGDKFKTFRLSSTRELIRDNANLNKFQYSAIYGGIRYDNSIEISEEQDALRSGFSYLPATLDEANTIAQILETKNNLVDLYTGYEGTEYSIKSLSGTNLSHLHIATHGFYINENEITQYARAFPTLSFEVSAKDVGNASMQRSGLLLSGANKSKSINSDNDGILTSAEIANIDLNQTELVVLSACQTGLGKISTEGVWGLQRGFKKAGVGAIIMSLWKVNDYSTRLMMEEFYRKLNSGKSIVSSFNAAINKVRKFRGKVDIDGRKTRVNFSDPQYWAPFILLDCVE